MKLEGIVAEFEKLVKQEAPPISAVRMGGIGMVLVRKYADAIKSPEDGRKLVEEYPEIFNEALVSHSHGTLLDALRSAWREKIKSALGVEKRGLFLSQFPDDVDVKAHMASLADRMSARFAEIYVGDEDRIGDIAIRSAFDALNASKLETASVMSLKKAAKISPTLYREFWGDIEIASDLCDHKAVRLAPVLVQTPMLLPEKLANYYDADVIDAARVAADVKVWEEKSENSTSYPDEDFDRIGELLIAAYGHLIRLEGGQSSGASNQIDVQTGDFYSR
jgi:hypothetical protein